MSPFSRLWMSVCLLLVPVAAQGLAQTPGKGPTQQLTREHAIRVQAAQEQFRQALKVSAEGKHREALSLAQKVVETFRQIYGNQHDQTAVALDGLGTVMSNSEDYAGARTCYEEALAIKQQRLGDKHTETAVSLSNLGTLSNKTALADSRS